ncbi:MAG TPA: hypothetical protein PLZ95_12885 [Bryobacteraceae bacterium]|nr:hypothetical protein [Bryobacteraceae bacterium]
MGDALARWTELFTAPNPFRARAIEDSPSLAKRESRLAARIPIARPGRLL